MRTLITVFVCSFLAGCGPYEGGDLRSQHQGGVSSQVSLDGIPVVSEEREERARSERLEKEESRQRREEARQAAVAGKPESEVDAASAPRAEATPPSEATSPSEAAPSSEEGGTEAVEADKTVETPGGDGVEEVAAVPPLPKKLELEGNLAALIAEEEARGLAAAALDEKPGDDAPATEGSSSQWKGDTTAAPLDAISEPEGSEALAAVAAVPSERSASTVPALPDDAVTLSAGSEPASIPAISADAALPPCDPNDLAAVALRDLSLKQTFGDGESARAVLTSAGGSEYVVGKGSVVGPDGARVVRVSPGELILAEIQFDMGGSPVMVQKALRMELPR